MREEIRSFCETFKVPAVDEVAVLASFTSEMSQGLKGQESSLAMIPSYITVDNDVPNNEPVIVIDAGGTNLRVCLVTFDESGSHKLDSFAAYSMPGIDKELSKDEFYSILISYLEPVLDLSNKIGFCFSYPTEITPDKDGKLLYWTKEVKVPELVGQHIGVGLNVALVAAGYDEKSIVILNDTVATLLAGKAKAASGTTGYVGFILGTGINAAYSESNSVIAAVDEIVGGQIINEEAGSFGGAPQNTIDSAFDSETDNPGCHVFEKMISGRYLGSLCLAILKKAVEENVLAKTAVDWVNGLSKLESKDVSFILSGDDDILTADLNDSDKSDLCNIFECVIDRAAHLAAIAITASAVKSVDVSADDGPVCITIDGSTFYKLHGLRERCESYLESLLKGHKISYQIVSVDDAPVIGTAIAGLCG